MDITCPNMRKSVSGIHFLALMSPPSRSLQRRPIVKSPRKRGRAGLSRPILQVHMSCRLLKQQDKVLVRLSSHGEGLKCALNAETVSTAPSLMHSVRILKHRPLYLASFRLFHGRRDLRLSRSPWERRLIAQTKSKPESPGHRTVPPWHRSFTARKKGDAYASPFPHPRRWV